MSGLEEIKIPKYIKGMDYSEYIIKLNHEAGTRGRMKEAITGAFFNKINLQCSILTIQ